MKRIICMIMAAVLCLGMLTACGGDDEEMDREAAGEIESRDEGRDEGEKPAEVGNVRESDLIGTWSYESDSVERVYTFTSDGKGTLKTTSKGDGIGIRGTVTDHFTWSLGEDNELEFWNNIETITYMFDKEESMVRQPGGWGDYREIYWYISGNTMYMDGMKLIKEN